VIYLFVFGLFNVFQRVRAGKKRDGRNKDKGKQLKAEVRFVGLFF
jgi:hypothetical protein